MKSGVDFIPTVLYVILAPVPAPSSPVPCVLEVKVTPSWELASAGVKRSPGRPLELDVNLAIS